MNTRIDAPARNMARGDVAGAPAALERALALAELEGYVRLFADEGLVLFGRQCRPGLWCRGTPLIPIAHFTALGHHVAEGQRRLRTHRAKHLDATGYLGGAAVLVQCFTAVPHRDTAP